MLWSAAFVLVWGAWLRWLSPLPAPSRGSWTGEAALALVCGVGFAVATTCWLAPYHLTGHALSASDFAQYCESVGAVQAGHARGVHPQRSMYEALLPGTLARSYGIMGGLVLSAAIAQAVTGASLYVWARAVAGRAAGVSAVAFAAAMLPLVLLGRTATFYPQTVAAVTLAAACAAVALTVRSAGALLVAGVAAGLAALWDVRGLYWAGVTVLACAPAVWVGPDGPAQWAWPWRWLRRAATPRAVRAAALLLPLALSWGAGGAYTPPNAQGLTVQTMNFVKDAPGAASLAQERAQHDLVWGRTSVGEGNAALAEVAALNASVRPDAVPGGLARAAVVPWLAPAALALVAIVVTLRRSGWALAAALVPGLPFAASLVWAVRVGGHLRYLGVSAPVLACWIGVGACLALRGDRGPFPRRLRPFVVVGALLLLVSGVFPGWLSPEAPWRERYPGERYPDALLSDPPSPGEEDAACVALLADDRARGRSWPLYEAAR